MRLNAVGRNQTVVETEYTRVLFSYNTPVAAFVKKDFVMLRLLGLPPQVYIKTSTFHSRTTSKHINAFLDGAEATPVPQSFLDGLV